MKIYRVWKSKWLKRKFVLDFQSMKFPDTETMGPSLRVPHTTLYTVGMDYDRIRDDVLDEILIYLQELHHLGDFHVFYTSEYGRHVLCVDELQLRETAEVIENSACDWLYKRGIGFNEYHSWVLRGWEKGERERPKFMRTIESPYNGERLQSKGHAEYLRLHFRVNVRLVNPDGNDEGEIEIQNYLTGSLTTVKELLKERGDK